KCRSSPSVSAPSTIDFIRSQETKARKSGNEWFDELFQFALCSFQFSFCNFAPMSLALWSKAFAEARLLLAALTVLLFGFMWLFVWLTSQVSLENYGAIMALLPTEIVKLTGVPLAGLVSDHGRIAMGYVDPVVLLATLSWSISRGSDVISGEISRGTME